MFYWTLFLGLGVAGFLAFAGPSLPSRNVARLAFVALVTLLAASRGAAAFRRHLLRSGRRGP